MVDADVTIRPLTEDDIEAARAVQVSAFEAKDRSTAQVVPELTSAMVERQRGRFRHFMTHDPQGAWVASIDGTVVGTALALRRDSLWGLSLLAVDPQMQSNGIGRRLLDAALRYADGADSAVILSSSDPRAVRSYATAGFDLHPQVRATGPLDRSVLPAGNRRVRPGDLSRTEWADALDRQVRGAARGPDHTVLGEMARMLVVDDRSGSGYAYLRTDGRILTVVATDDETATTLLWECLAAEQEGDRTIDHVNGAQQWAVRVALEARLPIQPSGPVFWRGRALPTSYLPDGAYL